MTPGDWASDRRPVRRVVAGDAAPVGSQDWPASIAAVAHVLEHGLEPPGVTLLVGENGSGKSTLVEAVAMAFGLAAEGGTRNAPMHGCFTRQESFSTERDPRFHEMSHGESFLAILRTRFDSPGLYFAQHTPHCWRPYPERGSWRSDRGESARLPGRSSSSSPTGGAIWMRP